MGLAFLTLSESLIIAETINSYSRLFKGIKNDPIVINKDNHEYSVLPNTIPNLGFAVCPIAVTTKFETYLKERFGNRPDLMSYLRTEKELAKEKKFKFEINWYLRIQKEKGFFKTKYLIQSNLTSQFSTRLLTLGEYEGNKPEEPVHSMFLDMR